MGNHEGRSRILEFYLPCILNRTPDTLAVKSSIAIIVLSVNWDLFPGTRDPDEGEVYFQNKP